MKTEIKKEKVEVVRQVKLTAKQRLTLVEMSNNGGRSGRSCYMDCNVRADLQSLGLIVERSRFDNAEKAAILSEVKSLWKSLPALVRTKSADALDKAVDNIRAKERSLAEKTWWLTDAANEYLVKGRVVITR